MSVRPPYYVFDSDQQCYMAPSDEGRDGIKAPDLSTIPQQAQCNGKFFPWIVGGAIAATSLFLWSAGRLFEKAGIGSTYQPIATLAVPIITCVGILIADQKKRPPQEHAILSHLQEHGWSGFVKVERPEQGTEIFVAFKTRSS